MTQAVDPTLPALIDALRGVDGQHGLTLVDAGGRETRIAWRALRERARRRAGQLHDSGVEAGDGAVICPTNDPEVLDTLLGLLYLGGVPLAVAAPPVGQAPGVQATFLAGLLGAGHARWVCAQRELDASGLPPARVLAGGDASGGGDVRPPACPLESDVALVQFSSGSTSRPKGIRLTHRNLLANLRLAVAAAGRREGDALATWLPLSHDMGLVGTLLACLLVRPREAVLMHPMRFLMRPATWLAALSRTRSTVSVCPPFALDLCVERLDPQALAPDVDLSALERLLVGAETVRPETVRRFEEAFRCVGLRAGTLRPVYGLAEATLIVTAPDGDEDLGTRAIDGREVTSVGRPLGDFELRIAREDGCQAAVGDVGEIQLRGGSVTPGFLDASWNERCFEDGWLRTGDLGALDEQGRLYVTGRSKDLLIVDGRNHYAHDVAAALDGLPGLKRGGVHAFTVHGESRKRVVVLAAANGAGDAELGAEVQRRVLACCGLAVDDVVFVPRLPRTPSGKVRRDACRDLYQAR